MRRVDNAIHSINHYPTDSVMCFVRTYSMDNPIYYVRRLHCSASNPMDREVRATLDTHFNFFFANIVAK